MKFYFVIASVDERITFKDVNKHIIGGYLDLDFMSAFYLSRFTGCSFSDAPIYFTIKLNPINDIVNPQKL